jgi:tetratricopeptide (TPR) repeat protein
MRLAAHVETFFTELRRHLALPTTGIVEVRCAPDMEELVARGIARHAESDLHTDVYLDVELTDAASFARSLASSLDAALPGVFSAIGRPTPARGPIDDAASALRALSAAHSAARGAVARFVLGGRAAGQTLDVLDWLAPLYLAQADVETTKILVLTPAPRALARRLELGRPSRLAPFRPASVAEHETVVEAFLDSPTVRVLIHDVTRERARYLHELAMTARPRAPSRLVSYEGAIGSLPRALRAAHAALFPEQPEGDVVAFPCVAFAEALDHAATKQPLTLLLSLAPTQGVPAPLRNHELALARTIAERLASLLTVARVILTCPGIATAPDAPVWLEPLVLTLDAAAVEADLRAQLGDPALPRAQRIPALVGMAGLVVGRGQDDEALRLGLEACQLARGDRAVEPTTLYALGTTLYRLGRHEQAVAMLSHATTCAVHAGQLTVAAHALVLMAGSHLAAGVHDVALRCLDAAVASARASGSLSVELFARMWRGETLAASGDDEAAVLELRAAHQLAERPSAMAAQLAPQAAEIHARLGALLASRGLRSHGEHHVGRGHALGCAHPLAPLP